MKLILDKVCVDYKQYRAVDGMSFEMNAGEVVSIVGPNGSGKSTIIKSIARILKPSSGGIFIGNRNVLAMSLREAALLMSYVPQNLPDSYNSTVADAVLLGRRPHIDWNVSMKDLEAVDSALARMGIKELAKKVMGQLSGGERQRVYIARALAQDPGIFLFDEPTNNLDLKNQLETLETVRELAMERRSMILIALHDLNLAYNYSDRVVMLNKGRLYAFGKPQDVLTAKNITDVYGVNVSIIDSGGGKYIVPIKNTARASSKALA
jgi:iron complex transport system ATP-binding protein